MLSLVIFKTSEIDFLPSTLLTVLLVEKIVVVVVALNNASIYLSLIFFALFQEIKRVEQI